MMNLMELRQLRRRRIEAEAAEVEEVDAWLATMRSGPEMVLYSAHPAKPHPVQTLSAAPRIAVGLAATALALAPAGLGAPAAHSVQARPQQRRKKRRR